MSGIETVRAQFDKSFDATTGVTDRAIPDVLEEDTATRKDGITGEDIYTAWPV